MSGVQTRKGRPATQVQAQPQPVPVVPVVPPARVGRGASASRKAAKAVPPVQTAAKAQAANTTAHGTMNSVSTKKGKSKTGKSKQVQSNQPIVQQSSDDGNITDLDDEQNVTQDSEDDSDHPDTDLDDSTIAKIAEEDIKADEKLKKELYKQIAVLNKRQKEAVKTKKKAQERAVTFVTPRTPERERPSRRPEVEKDGSPSTVGERQLGVFDGKVALETFLLRFERCEKRFKWKESDRVFFLTGAIMEYASFILKIVGPEASCDEIIQQLKTNFGNDRQYKRNQANLNNRRRQRGEKLEDFYLDLCRLRAKVMNDNDRKNYPEEYYIEIFAKGLDNEKLRKDVLMKDPRSMEEAFNAACTLETISTYEEESPSKTKVGRKLQLFEQCSNVPEGYAKGTYPAVSNHIDSNLLR